MRLPHVLLRGSVITVLVSLTIACNAILGVEEVALDCQINSDFPLIASNTSTSLTHFMDQGLTGPDLSLVLNADADPDYLTVRLYDNMGQHGMLNAPGLYLLTADDAKRDTCGICVSIDVYFDNASGNVWQPFWARDQGELMLTKADSTGLAGTMHNLKFRRVSPADFNVDVNNGCMVTIEKIEFNMGYSTAAR